MIESRQEGPPTSVPFFPKAAFKARPLATATAIAAGTAEAEVEEALGVPNIRAKGAPTYAPRRP